MLKIPVPPLATLAVSITGLSVAITCSNAHATVCSAAEPANRPTIGLVLGGGGARGGAHVGVLRYLEENHIPVDVITGTSMGAIIGGLYATGMSVDEVERLLLTTDWGDMFSDATDRSDWPLRRKTDDDLGLYGPKLGLGKGSNVLPGGAVAGQKIGLLLEEQVSQRVRVQHFDDLPIPFRAVAADLASGEMVVLEDGQLSVAMRASMSVPGAFDPVRMGDRLLVDGGIVRNLPVDIARRMGADIVIAVDVSSPKLDADDLDNLLSVVNQLTTLMVVGNTERQIANLGKRDVLIVPELGAEYGSAEFDRAAEIIPFGYEASQAAAAGLAGLGIGESGYQAWRQSVHSCQNTTPRVQFVRLENNSRFSDAVIMNKLHIEPGAPLDHARMQEDIGRIYALGFVRHARYLVVEEDGQPGVVIEIEEDPRGTDFIETGLALSGDGRGASLDLKLAYLKTDLSPRGAEFRSAIQLGADFGLAAEVYYPLDDRLRWILEPRVMMSRHELLVFDPGGHPLGELEIEETGGSIAFGREFGRHAGLFAGISRYSGKISVGIGTPAIDNYRFDGGDWNLKAVYDRLDDRYMPSTGQYVSLQYIDSLPGLGADDEFEQLRFQLFAAHSWERHTFWLASHFDTTLDDNAPIYGLFTGGGFLNMSGYERDELVGQHFGFSLLGYRYRMGQSGLLPAYVGATVEYGGAAYTADDVYGKGVLNGSFYLGYDSPIGPLYLGYGWSENRSGLLFLRLGVVLGESSVGRR